MDLDPSRGVFRWARGTARLYRTRFWVGSVFLTLCVTAAALFVHVPASPSVSQRAVNGVVGLGAGVVVVLILTSAFALAVAPYQQRNALRTRLKAAESSRAEAVMPAAHATQLKNIATSLHDTLGSGPCRYIDGQREDAHLRTLFRRHFPELVDRLDESDSFASQLRSVGGQTARLIEDSTRERWPDLNTNALNEYCFGYVRKTLQDPSRPTPEFVLSPSAKAILQGTLSGGTVLRSVDGTDEVRAAAQIEVESLQAWVLEMCDAPPVVAWRAILARRTEVRASLSADLEKFIHASAFKRDRCDETCAAA